MDVHGKSAIITGAGSGINLTFAQLLLSKSCSVLIADLTLTPAASALLTQPHPGGAKALFKHTDVTDWKQLAELFPFAAASGLGVPDIVVPGAGIFEPEWSNFFLGEAEGEETSRYRTIDVNLVHPIKLTRLAFSHFLSAGKEKAAVIHISSVAGQIGRLGTPIYSATKFGINGFVRSMGGMEGVFGIRVSAVAPGVIRTPLWEEHPEKLKMFEEGKDVWVEPQEAC
ncbi:NAD(P)-binding protein [Wilcoxina mikolae CBS 423.85]|nr:NAD(P)-binding protein [Wilcoxina mikolae CBS 423.85]